MLLKSFLEGGLGDFWEDGVGDLGEGGLGDLGEVDCLLFESVELVEVDLVLREGEVGVLVEYVECCLTSDIEDLLVGGE